jgi:hypothetical protein
MILGQSAGCAASLALEKHKTVHELDYAELRTSLLKAGQILEIPENWLEIITTNN